MRRRPLSFLISGPARRLFELASRGITATTTRDRPTRALLSRSATAGLLASGVLLAGCSSAPIENPSFPVTRDEAKRAMAAIEEAPTPLERPLVILCGYLDVGAGGWWVEEHFKKMFDDDRILVVSYASAGDLDEARAAAIAAVDEAYPSNDPARTVAVDVIGISLGGLVGRTAAIGTRDDPDARRLDVVRLFSLAGPQRGAELARIGRPGSLMAQLRTDDGYFAWLDEAEGERPYELHCYVRLGDDVVGAENAAPTGVTPWWVANPAFEHAHVGGTLDERFWADIALRLRGDEPFGRPPPAPLPEAEGTSDARSARDSSS